MVCKKCGASLLGDDQFCPECGAKVIRKKRCPECGETLREGIRFCPSCGAEVGEDMPKRKAEPDAPRKKANPAPPKKRPVRSERPPRRRDWEEDEWDDEDDDDEEESVDVLSIMTVAVGCILLVILCVLGFKLYQRYVPKNYDKAADGQMEEQREDEAEQEDGQRLEEPAEEGEQAESETVSIEGTIVTVADVRIRDNPSTQGTTVITTAKKGDTFEYLEVVEGGYWYKILLPEEYGYEYGYVSADYVEPQ